MKNTPIDFNLVTAAIDSLALPDFSKATIREIVTVAKRVEADLPDSFIHMEMGIPGLAPEQIGVEAEIAALRNGVAAVYPPLPGIDPLKVESARFAEAFLDLKTSAEYCIPTVGSMQGAYAAFLVSGQSNPAKDTVLFIDPGFPVQKDQLRVLGMKYVSFDMYDHRGDKLMEKLEQMLAVGNICNIIYSNPNNPSWVCLTEQELEGIGRLATKYDTIVIEDLAYFGMDFRKDYSHPFVAPFQPSVHKYTDNYLIMISGSKAFSYAGQRIGVSIISPKLYSRNYEALKERYTVGEFGKVFVDRVLYTLSSGVAHSSQHALAAMFKAANNGEYNFLESVQEYGRRAEKLKEIFCNHGFHIIYDNDMGEDIGSGFYFTIGYGNMSGGELMRELLYYGVSAIALDTTGSLQQGLRVCTSFIKDNQYALLDERMKIFAEHHAK
ncbi:MAG: pyridoxal phosphate-dependent aminotransferase [Rikenellaceae bacterium]